MSENKLYDSGLKYFTVDSVDQIVTLATGIAYLEEMVAQGTLATLTIYDDVSTDTAANQIGLITSTAVAGKRYRYGIPLTRGLTVDFNIFVGEPCYTIIYKGG